MITPKMSFKYFAKSINLETSQIFPLKFAPNPNAKNWVFEYLLKIFLEVSLS